MRCEEAEPQEAGRGRARRRGGAVRGGGAVRCEEAEPQEAGRGRDRILLKFDTDIQGKPRKKHSNPHDISSKLLSFFVVHLYIINSLFVG